MKIITFLICTVVAVAQTRVIHEGQFQTAGTGGVTGKLLAAKDTSNPVKYVLPAAGLCGSGVAQATASAAATFYLLNKAGADYTNVAEGTITSGHVVTGGVTTPGRVVDTGATTLADVPNTTCVVGIAQASATDGQDVLVRYLGAGMYGSKVVHSVGATFDGAGSTLVPGASAVGFKTIPFPCTKFDSYAINIRPSGTVTFHVWRLPAGSANPTSANDLSTNGFTITTGTAFESTNVSDLSSPDTALGDILGINLSDVTGSPVWASFELRCH